MSRKRSKTIPVEQTPTPKKANKVLGYGVFDIGTRQTPKEVIDKDAEFVPWFQDNEYPKVLIDLSERSTLHRTCLNIKETYILGQELEVSNKDGSYYDGDEAFDDYISDVNADGESLYSLITRWAQDYTRLGAFVVLYIKRGNRINIEHRDASKFRWSKDKKKLLYSNDWNEIAKDYPKKLDKAEEKGLLISYDVWNEQEQDGEYAQFVSDYSIGHSYYPIPDYMTLGFEKWAEIDYKIPAFNYDRIENKFMPSGFLQLFGDPPEDETPSEYLSNFTRKFTGEGNNSKIVAQLLTDSSQAALFQEFNDAPQGIFIDLQKLAMENILAGHRTPPQLLLATPGKLANDSEIRSLYDMYMNTVINQYRTTLVRPLNKLFKYLGFNQKLWFVNIKPVGLSEQIDPMQCLTPNEQRAELGYLPIGQEMDTEIGKDGNTTTDNAEADSQ